MLTNANQKVSLLPRCRGESEGESDEESKLDPELASLISTEGIKKAANTRLSLTNETIDEILLKLRGSVIHQITSNHKTSIEQLKKFYKSL